MTRRRALMVVPLVCLAALVATSVQAAESILSVIPDKALGFAVVNRLADADAKIQAIGKQLQLPVQSLLQHAKKSTGLKQGLNENGGAAVVVMPPAEEQAVPRVLVFLPVTNYRQFVQELKGKAGDAGLDEVSLMDETFVVGQSGGYAVLAERKDRDTLKKALAAPGRVSADLAPLEQWLTENDAAIVVTRAGVEMTAAMVQKGLREVRESFGRMPEEFQEQMKPAIAVFEIYEKFFKAAEANVQTYAAALHVDSKGNVHVVSRLRGVPGGALAKAMGAVKAPAGDLLKGFPAGPFVVVGGGLMPEEFLQGLIDFSVQIMKAAPQLYGLDEEQAGKLAAKAQLSMKGIRGMSMLMGVGKPGDPIFSHMAAVITVDDSKQYLGNYRKYLEAVNELVKDSKGSVLGKTEVQETTIGGVPALEMRMKLPKMPGMEDAPGFETMMKAMFGPGGSIVAYIAAADDHTVVMTYTSKDPLLECLQAVKGSKGGLAADAAIAQVSALLMPGAQWVGYWSPKGTMDFVNGIIAILPDEVGAQKLPWFPASPPIGFAAKAAAGEMQCQMVVPGATIKAIGEYVKVISEKLRTDAKAIEVIP